MLHRVKFFTVLACVFFSSLSITEATSFAPVGPLSVAHVLVAECTDKCTTGFLVDRISNARFVDPMMRTDLFEVVNITYTYSISDIHTLDTTAVATLDTFIQRNRDVKNSTFEFEVSNGYIVSAQRIESSGQVPLQSAFQKWSDEVKQSNTKVARDTIYSLIITFLLYSPLLLLSIKRFSVYWPTIILVPFVILVLLFLISQTFISQDTFLYGYTFPLIYLLLPIIGVLVSFGYLARVALKYLWSRIR